VAVAALLGTFTRSTVHREPHPDPTPAPTAPKRTALPTPPLMPYSEPPRPSSTVARPRWRRQLEPSGFEIRTSGAPPVDTELEPSPRAEPRLDEAVSGKRQPRPRNQALFAERLAPSLLAAMVATDAGDGPENLEMLVHLLASRQFPLELPRRQRPSLLRGAQLLVDVGRSMTPFRHDTAVLADVVFGTVGRTNVRRMVFADSPLRGMGTGARWTWTSGYVAPDVGTPVLVVTDLGIGGPADHHARSRAHEWITLAERLRRRGSPLVALVPYPPHRWPDALVGQLAIVTWDRRTTLSDVRSARRSLDTQLRS
jgi:hypothetical protein